MRAVLEEVPGAHFRPQVWIGSVGRADLVDRCRHVAVECDSFEFHADAEALNNDMERYNAFVCEDTWCSASAGSTRCSSRTTSAPRSEP